MQPSEPNSQSNQSNDQEGAGMPANQPPQNQDPAPDTSSGDHPLLGAKQPPALRPFSRPINVNHDTGGSSPSDAATPAAEPSSLQAETQPQPDTGLANAEPAATSGEPLQTTSPLNSYVFSDSDAAQSSPTPGVVYGNFGGADGVSPRGGKGFFKRPLLVFGALAVLLLAGGGYVLGYYVPNKPENVYKTGLSRTGMAMDKLTAAGMTKEKLTTMKNIDFSGNLSVTGPSGKQSGSFSTRYNDTTSNSQLTYDQGNGGKGLTAQALTQLDKGQKYPDIYFKITGFAGLGLDELAPGIDHYDGQWINVSPAYLESLIPAQDPASQQSDASKFTPEDAAALTKVVVDTTREYVFTNDPAKTVLVNKGFKGKETIEGGIKADRYTVGINKAHAKDYCKALITNVTNAPAFKDIPGVPTDSLDQDRQDAITACQQGIDQNLKDSDTFDMWVGQKTKMINKIRITDEKDSTTWVEFGQTYASGSKLPLFATVHSGKDKYDAKLELNVDMDKSTTDGSMDATADDSGQKWTISASFSFKPDAQDITITKPKDAIPVQQVLQALGMDPAAFASDAASAPNTTDASVYSGVQAKAKDTERQTDLRALQSQLEASYANYGAYPTLDQINSPAWRSANMRGLDDAALADPDGGIKALAVSASSTQYGYGQTQCTIKGCQGYILTALLSTGTPYTLQSLN